MILGCMDAWNIHLDPPTAAQLYTGIIFDTGCFRHSNTSGPTHLVAARLLEQGIDHSAIAIKVLLERRRSGMALQARVLDNATFHAASRVVQGVVSRRVMDQLNSSEADVEGIVEAMIYVEGVEVAVLIVERGPELVKLSLRSRGQVDVSAVARALHASGGGHAKAAGVILREPLAEVVSRVPRAIELAFGEPVRAVNGLSAVKTEASAGAAAPRLRPRRGESRPQSPPGPRRARRAAGSDTARRSPPSGRRRRGAGRVAWMISSVVARAIPPPDGAEAEHIDGAALDQRRVVVGGVDVHQA
jgi:hypothetical protein